MFSYCPLSGKHIKCIWLFGVSGGEAAEKERDPELYKPSFTTVNS